jgi:hypothetical protein
MIASAKAVVTDGDQPLLRQIIPRMVIACVNIARILPHHPGDRRVQRRNEIAPNTLPSQKGRYGHG